MHRVPLGLPAAQRLTQPAKGYNTKTLAPSTRCLRSTTQSTRQALPTLEAQLCTYLHHRHHNQHHPTMSFVLPGLRRGLLLSAPLILSAPLLAQHVRFGQRIQCDGPDPLTKITSDLTSNYTTEARTPVITQSGAVNPRAIRQISMGSILGVIGGLGISVFSKPLAVLIGLGIFVLQAIESRGIHIIPYSFLQRRLKSTNVKSLVRDNVAFKLSFGLTFALAAFTEF